MSDILMVWGTHAVKKQPGIALTRAVAHAAPAPQAVTVTAAGNYPHLVLAPPLDWVDSHAICELLARTLQQLGSLSPDALTRAAGLVPSLNSLAGV
jgi:hypothetical protein